MVAPDQEIRFLGDLQRLEVKPGDRFVLSVDERLSQDMVAHLQAKWAENMGADVKLLVLSKGMKLGVVGHQEAP